MEVVCVRANYFFYIVGKNLKAVYKKPIKSLINAVFMGICTLTKQVLKCIIGKNGVFLPLRIFISGYLQMEKYIDMHCHILPAVDDGSASLAQSVSMVKIAYEDGIRKIIATPHYHIGRCIAEYDESEEAFRQLKEEIEKLGIDMELYIGSEIYFYSEAMEKLEEGMIHTMNNGSCILLEYDPGSEYTRIVQGVNAAVIAGYVPIVAHVERYMCMVDRPERCEELVHQGAYLQVNASSVVGKSGKEIQKFIFKLMKKKLISFVATDAHSDGHRRPVLSEAYMLVKKKFKEEYADRLFYGNPLKIIESKL